MSDHALTVWSGPLAELPERDVLDDAAALFRAASKSEATRRAYRSDIRDFAVLCREQDVDAIPALPRTVTRYVSHLASLGRSVSTIDRRVAAIAFAHRSRGENSPTGSEEVRAVLTGIRNTLGRRPVRK